MNPMIFIILLGTIVLGTSIVMTSSHWFMTWLGFEMNMMAIVPVFFYTLFWGSFSESR